MIASIAGTVLSFTDDSLVVDVGGVGLLVHVPSTVFDGSVGVGQTVNLFTHLAVREDSLTLYGFAALEQRTMFEALVGVSGVGTRLALSVLSTLSPDVLRSAVGGDQPEVISRVPGIGKKTAEKIVFHLKDKLGPTLPALATMQISDADTEVLAALAALGYSVVEAQTALQSLPKDAPDDVEARIRLALQYFS
ncbi:MAG: Holliday junction branch migration protein RuvA [Anaerolineales bacterium]